MEITRCSVPTATRAPDDRTNAYVLGCDPAVLVDPAGRTDELDRLVRDRGVEHVLVTHPHPDHVDAVEDYARETNATVWARAGRTDRFREATGVDPDRTFGQGTELPAGDDRVEILETPGHAPDHVGIRAGADGPICSGDCAVAEGSVVVGAPEGDMRAYLCTLRRLRAMAPPRLYPGHGPPIADPEATLDGLISHRLERERQVRKAVDNGARTLMEILDASYEKDLTGVRDLARATVVAHLEKLAVEGHLEWDGECARPR
ncbi:MBL fold metallo-hydrolase [Natronoglomus mannanivorans]|uniref:MBL fold metallo-hydrolase n=1 Tax=Natronoglomus mannanivorans TaxID=2979990 RepID=A0AAP2YZZ0_9EURY|nr:MBL fold metallo-hydrolase [Halobacteria archaeon AArc-xg1-1]